MSQFDAVVVGSGPNGLAAAIAIAQAGRRVAVYEQASKIGGGARTDALTLPGFAHDVCSAVHPFGVASPFFRTLPLGQHGLEWIEPPAMFAHPFDGGTSAIVYRSIDRTVEQFGPAGERYRHVIGGVVNAWSQLESAVLGPFRLFPRHPVSLARFGWHSLGSAARICRNGLRDERTCATLAGCAAHGMVPLDMPPTGGIGLVLNAMAHIVGWPLPRGGSQSISDALASHLRSLGGEIHTDAPVKSIDELPPARAILCDLSPKPLLRIAGHRFPSWYRAKLERYRYGMGTFKMDWALDGPIPWKAANCALSATVHLGGTFAEISRSERDAWEGRMTERPYVLLVQPTLFDPSRAPAGKHTAWAYCHVPHASTADMVSCIEAQIERFAPGFKDRILARHVMTPADLERRNPNFVGGDIGSGVTDLWQLFTRPTWRMYGTPVKGLYLCSAATPPGVGVHGMCGYYAAQMALKEMK